MSDRTVGPWHVVELAVEQTYGLRRAVLRDGTPTDEVRFAEDGWPGVVHLGAIEDGGDGDVLGTSTWIPRAFAHEPDVDAVQLRGMATAKRLQGVGVGAVLLEAGCERATDRGAALVWANARDAALGFYIRHGFVVVGAGFVDTATTGLPHHLVARRLD